MVVLPFLKEIATILLQPGSYHLPETCVVFPNKRARLYLSKYIGELTDKPVWAPRYLSINELMESLSGFVYADRLTILFELFEVYKLATQSPESFDSFYHYAEPLLSDFDEIDKYLVNSRDLLSNLAGLKALEGRFNYLSDEQVAAIQQFWNTFDPDNASDGQKTFISLWNVLPEMYSGLRERLSSKGLAYEGMAYRKVAESLSANKDLVNLHCQKYLFVGFNALNTCEEKLFRFLRNSGKAEFYWDYDNWYVDNDIHEAGHFMRRNLQYFPQVKQTSHENFTSDKKHIYFLPVPSNTGQAECLPLVFEKLNMRNQDEIEHTALVLADENLLIPALYAIPESVKKLNVTMGYPIAGSAVFSLIDSLYELGRNRRKGTDGLTGFYFKDVLSILNNPMLKPVYGQSADRVRGLVIEKSLFYLTCYDILLDDHEDFIFQDGLDRDACHYLLYVVEQLIRRLVGGEGSRTDPVQLEILYQVYTFITRLKDILFRYTFKPDQETLFTLIRRMLRTLHIPFSGEPLSGMQLLGILETRTLDFKNVIVLSANEGVFPRSAEFPSFIPHNLRFGFGLPTPEHQDSIYAYYFYRLIQRASNVVLLYDNSSGGLRTGECSRFLHQLQYETPVKVEEIKPAFFIARIAVKPIQVEKTGDIAELLLRYSGREAKLLSPSALNEFLDCPLRFYFHHIAGLPQPDTVSEDIDARIFGTLLHKAMQILYGRFGDTTITPGHLKQLDDQVQEEAIERSFSEVLFGDKEFRNARKIEGFNLIVKQVIKSYMRNMIRADGKDGPFRILGLEQRFTVSLPLPVEELILDLQIGGTIDRVDFIQDRIRIIDYKTGTIKKTFSSVHALFESKEGARNDAVFQVLVYAMVYSRINPGNRVVPSLCFVRGSHADSFSYSIQYGEKRKSLECYDEVREEFEKMLFLHLKRLFNMNEPFTQTTNLKICQNCPYGVICRREGMM
jgi:CRISPR/Cas system-associated exonuclease Cas4 (RecB family)